jgi:hypothetical protein
MLATARRHGKRATPHLDVEALQARENGPQGAPGDGGEGEGHPRPAKPTGACSQSCGILNFLVGYLFVRR